MGQLHEVLNDWKDSKSGMIIVILRRRALDDQTVKHMENILFKI